MISRHSNKQVCIQYMSDLHLERIAYKFDVTKAAPLLILGGDIGRFCDFENYAAFLKTQCEKFDRVLLVAGNHEFYGSTREEGLSAARRLVEDPYLGGKLTFMHRTRVDIEDIIVLGCTLQSHIGPDCGRLTNDFRRIKDWSVEKHNTEHELDLEWLQTSLHAIAEAEPDKRVVVVTHYAPSFERTCHPIHENNAASQCFCSHTLKTLQDWNGAKQVSHWIFGHTHWNARFKCCSIAVSSNQLCNDSGQLTWWQKRFLYRSFDKHATITM